MKNKTINLLYLASPPLGAFKKISVQVSKNIYAKSQLRFCLSYQRSGKITFYPEYGLEVQIMIYLHDGIYVIPRSNETNFYVPTRKMSTIY